MKRKYKTSKWTSHRSGVRTARARSVSRVNELAHATRELVGFWANRGFEVQTRTLSNGIVQIRATKVVERSYRLDFHPVRGWILRNTAKKQQQMALPPMSQQPIQIVDDEPFSNFA
jgi:hypothetical protein